MLDRSRLRNRSAGRSLEPGGLGRLHLEDAVAHRPHALLRLGEHGVVRLLEVDAALGDGRFEGIGVARALNRLVVDGGALRLLLRGHEPRGKVALRLLLLRCSLLLNDGLRFRSGYHGLNLDGRSGRGGFLGDLADRRLDLHRRGRHRRGDLRRCGGGGLGHVDRHGRVEDLLRHEVAHRLAGQSGNRRLRGRQALRGGRVVVDRLARGGIRDLGAFGDEALRARGLLTMDRDLGLIGTDRGHVRTAAADAGGSLHQNRDARGVAIGTVVVRGDLAQDELHEGQCGGDHADDGDDGQHDIDRAGGMGEHRAAQQQQQSGQDEAAEDNPFDDRKRRQNRVLELGARLAAVVMSHEDDLAAAGVARFGRVARLVFRDDVLADAAREQTGKDRFIERLGDVDGRR